MGHLCTSAPPITNWALNGSHLHQCLLTQSECTQPTQMKCSPYTLTMHSSNSCMNTFLHTQNALIQLKSSALWIKCAQIHLSNSIKTYNAGLHIQCFETPPNSTNPGLVHLPTPNGLQNLKAPPKLFETPPRLQNRLQEPSRSENLHLQQTRNLKISLNAHKQSNL